jgi:hypothetical protein
MKLKEILLFMVLLLLALTPAACQQDNVTTSSTTPTGLIPPSPEELAANHFVLPEIPRILCEQLKQMMDKGDDFTLVDTRLNTSFKTGYIPGAINIPTNDSSPPFTQEWVTGQLNALPQDKLIILYCD